jgi:helix-turn-helix protein
LRAVRERSGGLFKPSAVGGYERGERAITLDRFCDLCSVYGVEPELVIARALGRGQAEKPGDIAIVLDVTAVEASKPGRGSPA